MSILSLVRSGNGYACRRLSYGQASTYRPPHMYHVTVCYLCVRTYLWHQHDLIFLYHLKSLTELYLTSRMGPVFTTNFFFVPTFIGSLGRSDRAASGISRNFEKIYFCWSYNGKKKSDFEAPIYGYLMWWDIWRKYDVIRSRTYTSSYT